MRDYFALLGQARSPWLDPDQLKQAFHAKTLRAHPDAQPAQTEDSDAAFAQLNEAYQVLRDPKRRLQHLLALRGETPAGGSGGIPNDIEEMFPAVASLTRQAEELLRKLATSTNALSLSLLRAELLRARDDVEQMLERIQRMHTAAENELQGVPQSADVLQQLYLRFSYLTRWMSELSEKKLRLSL